MNDRYLYRAKRTDNGEWVEGFLARYDERFEVANIVSNEILIPVIASTICQCTGLNDKNGKLIWENDIMVGHIDDMYPENATYTQVIWYKNGFYTKEKDSDDSLLLDEFDERHFEVCGNIFDNPELLEVGE